MPLSYGWPFWCEREHVSSNHRTPGTCWQTECLLLLFLGRGLHNASSQNRWTVVWHHVIGDIFASCFWNWGQMLACFSGIFMLWPTELAQENFWNLLKIYDLSWPSLTPILRIVLSAFLNWIFSISNPSSLPKHKDLLLLWLKSSTVLAQIMQVGFLWLPLFDKNLQLVDL